MAKSETPITELYAQRNLLAGQNHGVSVKFTDLLSKSAYVHLEKELKSHTKLFENLYRAHSSTLSLEEQKQVSQLQVSRDCLTKLVERID